MCDYYSSKNIFPKPNQPALVSWTRVSMWYGSSLVFSTAAKALQIIGVRKSQKLLIEKRHENYRGPLSESTSVFKLLLILSPLVIRVSLWSRIETELDWK